jgi:hypothetical protein
VDEEATLDNVLDAPGFEELTVAEEARVDEEWTIEDAVDDQARGDAESTVDDVFDDPIDK